MYGILRHTATIATVRFDLCHTSGHHQADLGSNFDDIATVWATIRYVSISVFINPTFSNLNHRCTARTLHT